MQKSRISRRISRSRIQGLSLCRNEVQIWTVNLLSLLHQKSVYATAVQWLILALANATIMSARSREDASFPHWSPFQDWGCRFITFPVWQLVRSKYYTSGRKLSCGRSTVDAEHASGRKFCFGSDEYYESSDLVWSREPHDGNLRDIVFSQFRGAAEPF